MVIAILAGAMILSGPKPENQPPASPTQIPSVTATTQTGKATKVRKNTVTPKPGSATKTRKNTATPVPSETQITATPVPLEITVELTPSEIAPSPEYTQTNGVILAVGTVVLIILAGTAIEIRRNKKRE
jgi:hypothetical protein